MSNNLIHRDNNNSKSKMFTMNFKRNIYEKKMKFNIHPKLSFLIRKKSMQLMTDLMIKTNQSNVIFKKLCIFISSTFILKITSEFFQGFISFFISVLYIFSTYIDVDNINNNNTLSFIRTGEIILISFIAIDLIRHFLKSKQKHCFFFKPMNFIDFSSILIVYIHYFEYTKENIGFLRVLRILRVVRILRIIKFLSIKHNSSITVRSAIITKKILYSVVVIFVFIVFSSGLIHYCNNEFNDYFPISYASQNSISCSPDQAANHTIKITRDSIIETHSCSDNFIYIENPPITFDIALYYMMITITTVGYGDIFPLSSYSRLLMGTLIIISIIIISKQSSEINYHLNNIKRYEEDYGNKNGKHLIIGGLYDSIMLNNILRELHYYREDFKDVINVVLVQRNQPSPETLRVLSDPKYESNIYLIVGDIIDEKVLEMTNVKNADQVFLFTDQNRLNVKDDQFLLLACKSISQISNAKINIQFNFSHSLINDWTDWNLSYCSNQIKYSVLIKNCFIHGFSTFFMNLVGRNDSFLMKNIEETPWMIEYINGASKSIFVVKCENKNNFPKDINFATLSKEIYLRFNILIIGVKHKIFYKEEEEFKDIFYNEYLINPVNYLICPEDSVIAIANDQKDANQIFSKPIPENTDHAVNIKSFLSNFCNVEDSNSKETEENDVYPTILLYKKFFNFKNREDINDLKPLMNNHFMVFCVEEQVNEFVIEFNKINNDFLYVVLNREDNSNKNNLWKSLVKKFVNIIKIEINYNKISDLIYLNLYDSKHIFILSYSLNNVEVADSGILNLVKNIEENFPECKYTLELTDQMSVKYLDNECPDFEIKNDNEVSKYKLNLIPFKLWPRYARSDFFFSGFIETLMPFCYYNKGVFKSLIKLLGIENNKISQKYRHKIKENKQFTMVCYKGNKKILYCEIIKVFMSLPEPLLCCGVYRGILKELKNTTRFIMTNPDKNSVIYPGDEIICIGQSSYFSKDSIFIKEMITEEDRFNMKEGLHLNINLQNTSTDDNFKDLDDNEFFEMFKNEFTSLKMSILKKQSETKTENKYPDEQNLDLIYNSFNNLFQGKRMNTNPNETQLNQDFLISNRHVINHTNPHLNYQFRMNNSFTDPNQINTNILEIETHSKQLKEKSFSDYNSNIDIKLKHPKESQERYGVYINNDSIVEKDEIRVESLQSKSNQINDSNLLFCKNSKDILFEQTAFINRKKTKTGKFKNNSLKLRKLYKVLRTLKAKGYSFDKTIKLVDTLDPINGK